jgi:ubiquinone/menaquinone biosynthesis C-methylase UbiE
MFEDYSDEPKDTFLPLPEELACQFYSLEMDNFTADIDFYESLLPQNGVIMEMGCGTGRITDSIARREGSRRLVIGIDISMPMLRQAKTRHPVERSPQYFCMNMVKPSFSIRFDAILIAYNTLNLLGAEETILACLQGCKNNLKPQGKLLVQLFIPTEDFIKQKKTFQFQMFDRPGGGKIIKEILRQYEPQSHLIHIEERFRVRPMQQHLVNEDWHKRYTIAGFSASRWLSLFHKAGFTPKSLHGDYTGNCFLESTSSILVAVLTL